MDLITIYPYFLLGGSICLFELLRPRVSPYDALFFLNASFFIYFVLAPLHVLVGGESFMRYYQVARNVGLGNVNNALWILVAYGFVLCGYYSIPPTQKFFAYHRIQQESVWVVLLVLMATAIVSTIIYSLSVGGLLTAFRQAIYIRMGVFKVEGPWLFFKHFIPLFGSSFVIAVSLFLREQYNARLIPVKYLIILPVFFILFIYGAILLGGRRVLLFPLVSIFFIFSNFKRRWCIKHLFFLFILFATILIFWDAISFGIKDANFSTYLEGRYASLMNAYAALWRPLADPYMGWVGLSHLPSPWLLFTDWLSAPFQLLPSGLFGEVLSNSLLADTTETLKGAPLGETAGIPPGFIGYLYLNGGYWGIIFGSLIYGQIGRVLHNYLYPRLSDPVGWTIYVWVIMAWAYFIRHGMLAFILSERFHWWLSLSVFLFILGLRSLMRYIFPLKTAHQQFNKELHRLRFTS